MTSDINNYKRIARNTLMLYMRMLFSLIVSLYTSRVVLNTLGFDDYGLYNVVGGFVSMMAFVNNYISQGTVRFLTFYIGKQNKKRLSEVFSSSLTLHIIIGLCIILIGETIGLWYVENKLNIASGREEVAMYVYQLSLATMFLGIIQTPFFASITAHEDMGIYAYISIFDVIMKLFIVYLLLIVNTDKLQLYATFYFIVSIITMSFYLLHCIRKYEECRFSFRIDKKLYLEMLDYLGWSAVGAVSSTLNGQGVTILLNYFFGTVINAARGVAGSVSNIVSQFVFNFQTAMRPQIIKSYATGNISEMSKLIIYSSKYSSYLVLILGLPIFIETPTIMYIWLGNVPPFAVEFVRLTIIQIIIQAIDLPIGMGINAVGKMKLPNLTSALVYLLILPISYIFVRFGANPTITYLISLFCYPIAMFFDVWILNKYTRFPSKRFYRECLLKTILFLLIISIIPFLIHNQMEDGFWRLIIVSFVSFAISLPLIYFKGLEDNAREIIKRKIMKFLPLSK